MGSDKTTARLAGALFITATVVSLLSTVLLNPVLNSSDYLLKTFSNQDRILAGAFFLLLSGFASAGIAISLYPVLRRHSKGLSLGSVSFRTIEGALYVVAAIDALLLLTLSQQFVRAGSPHSSYFQNSGGILRALRDQAGLAGVLAFCAGALMYYFVFWQSQLIPRWLSAWGIGGIALGLIAGLLAFFRVTGYMSAPQVVMSVPIGVQEMVLAVWLLARGFQSPAVSFAETREIKRASIERRARSASGIEQSVHVTST